ncbi:Stk1 family PASTA domain-containing Ser/Thr kinase [Nakamurella antarctica]|uniref:non-specific serine/threonine protein kinase n=1 Tax=Nakamurella antarctica TaxID=1902245 RepID=A0A3G8ZKU4_9ACTN|nr:Stk1 family PASTA domain-containing Ser/Thr kinase [Nakamurella antarctica]AZI57798.1 Stk1 family PASTA domain-containing Ser/Thr kinase [Nakamurella antarctica]
MDRQGASGLAGTVLDGRYRVGSLVARGGMSTVYRGVDQRLGRPVAIKIMKSEFAADHTFLARFEREARSAAGLGHPGVVSVYDHGRDGDVVFLVMELVDGGTLRDLLKQQGALSVPVALSILEPVLSALSAAHESGLIHRDVKPENVLISSKGEVKVADFGLVRAISSATMMTGDVILGTVAYLSPEQVSTGYADARSDVYAAGVLAYEMLTGNPPYSGDNAISVAYQHVHSDIPAVSEQAPGVPAALDDLLLDATSRDSADRPADAGAFLAELIDIRTALSLRRVPVPVPAVPVARPSAHGPTRSGTRPIRSTGPSATRAVRPTATVRTATDIAAEAHVAQVRSEPVTEMVPLPPARSPGRKRRRRRMIIVVIIVVLLGLGAAAGGWWLGSGRWTAVPALVGASQDTAQQQAADANLVVSVTSAYNNSVAAGRVVSVDPPVGDRQLRGSQIVITVSSGKPKVPSVEPGSSPADATAAIKAAALVALVDESRGAFDDAVAAGQVVATEPAAGSSVDIGSTVTVLISKGPQPAIVPQVFHKGVQDAENALKVAGFSIGDPIKRFDAGQPAGVVLATVPAFAATVPKGTPISLVVSNAIKVPDLANKTADQVEALLAGLGLKLTVGTATFDANVDGGLAISSSPATDTLVNPATPNVTVVFSNAITLPDVTGKNLDESAKRLDNLGVRVLTSSFWGFGDNVRNQEPSGGTRVPPGSTVSISTVP